MASPTDRPESPSRVPSPTERDALVQPPGTMAATAGAPSSPAHTVTPLVDQGEKALAASKWGRIAKTATIVAIAAIAIAGLAAYFAFSPVTIPITVGVLVGVALVAAVVVAIISSRIWKKSQATPPPPTCPEISDAKSFNAYIGQLKSWIRGIARSEPQSYRSGNYEGYMRDLVGTTGEEMRNQAKNDLMRMAHETGSRLQIRCNGNSITFPYTASQIRDQITTESAADSLRIAKTVFDRVEGQIVDHLPEGFKSLAGEILFACRTGASSDGEQAENLIFRPQPVDGKTDPAVSVALHASKSDPADQISYTINIESTSANQVKVTKRTKYEVIANYEESKDLGVNSTIKIGTAYVVTEFTYTRNPTTGEIERSYRYRTEYSAD